MPELPEVETTCRGIAPYIIKNKITRVIVRDHRLRWPIATQTLRKALKDQAILDVSRRAKYILIRTHAGTLVIHLGMSGTLQIVSADAPVRKHDHVDFVMQSGKVLRFNDPRRFGAVLFSRDPDSLMQLQDLGIEPLSRGFDGKYLYNKSRSCKVAVKTFLMNAKIVVGVGNIYANESLFLAKIHPLTPAKDLTLSQYQRLVKAIKAVLKAAIAKGGTTLKDFYGSDGKPGYFNHELKIYDRAGENCLVCQSPVQSSKINQRATYFCLHCQSYSA